MAHHKRRRVRSRRAGCKLCKYWKANGFRTERRDGEKFSDHRRRTAAALEAAAFRQTPSSSSVDRGVLA